MNTQDNVMGCQADICVERIFKSAVATGGSASTNTEDIEYHHSLTQWKVERCQVGLMS